YNVQMRDVRLKMYDKTIFYWPYMRSNLQRPDIPLKSVHTGHDRDWGTLVETRWYLSRLLGLREPEGVESTLALDYYGKRGVGAGVEINYSREDYFGRLLAYVIRDTGEDDLGRHDRASRSVSLAAQAFSALQLAAYDRSQLRFRPAFYRGLLSQRV
ncbi:MAG: hypothetical protein ACYSWR_05340, partial [Planctomycetota bacterium]